MSKRPRPAPVTSRALVAIASSAGGLEPLRRLLSLLPADFPAAIAIVQHRGDHQPTLLPELLTASTALRVRHAEDGDLLEPGTVYVCPPGMHMTAEHAVRLVPGPRLDYVRPSGDWMFESAARAYGAKAIGVVLSGRGADAAKGALAITEAGGTVVAQDPASCAFPGMPMATLASGRVQRMAIEQIAEVLRQMVDAIEAARPEPTPASPLVADGARRTTVVLVDDHRIILDGIRSLLRAESDLEVIGEAEDGRAAIRTVAALSPHVVVMDIGMATLNGIDATRQIKEQNPRTNVVALSARDDVHSAISILDSGATGYVCKNGAFGELALAIRLAAAGTRYVSPRFASSIDQRARASVAGRTSVPLTPSEREIIQLTVEGKTLDQIAGLICLDRGLIEARRRRVMDRLGIDGLPGLTRYAIREGLASIDG